MTFRWKFFLTVCLVGLLGLIISGKPLLVDQTTHFYPVIGQYLVFLFWLAGVVGWGDFVHSLQSRFQTEVSGSDKNFVLKLALGAFAASTFAGTLSLLLPYGPAAKYWATALILLGVFRLASRTADDHFFTLLNFDRWSKAIAWVIALAIVMKTIEATRLIRAGDPYVVYLTGPRLWFDAHGFQPFLENPIQFLSSTWENLFQWGNFLFAGAPGEGLDAAQRFAQWTTATVGYGGLCLALFAIFSTHSGSLITLLAILAALSIPSMMPSVNQAKNDMGVAFWSIAALIPLYLNLDARPFRNALLAGLLLGAAVIGKPPSVVFAFFAASLSMLRLSRSSGLRTALQATGWLSLGGLLAASPILLRNLSLTGNPFFPWLDSVFKSGLTGPMLTRGFSVPTVHQFQPTWIHYWGYLKEILKDQPLNVLSLLCLIPVVSTRYLKIPSLYRWLAAVAWLAALLFSWKLRPATELRYLGPALPLIAGLGILSTGYCLNALANWIRLKWLVPSGLAFLTVFLIATSGIPLHVLKRIPKGYFIAASQDVLEHEGGAARRWMRQHAQTDELILALGDNYFYYTLGLNYRDIHHYKPTDEVFMPSQSAQETVGLMMKFNARYFHHLLSIGGHIYEHLKPELERNKACRVYEDSQAHIYDVPCLYRGIHSTSGAVPSGVTASALE